MIKNFYNFIPKPLLKIQKLKAFFDKAKNYFDLLKTQINQIKRYRNPSFTRFPDSLVEHEKTFALSYLTIREKRKAIEFSRIAKKRPTSFLSIKPIIDEIIGQDCVAIY